MKLAHSRKIAVAALCLALGAFNTVSFAKDEHSHGKGHGDHAHGDHAHGEHAGGAGHEMDPAAMEAWAAAATPGPQHAGLASRVGRWNAEVKSYWMDPNQPVVSAGTVEYSMELGGRVLNGAHKSEMMGMPFEGRSIDGYDNTKGSYWSIWLDNMGTGYMMCTGNFSADGKTGTFKGTSWDAMAGKEVTYKLITKIIDANKHVFEMYAIDGKNEIKQMEITYTRG
ncbi:MAG: DUF1579 family protein [bacterium]